MRSVRKLVKAIGSSAGVIVMMACAEDAPAECRDAGCPGADDAGVEDAGVDASDRDAGPLIDLADHPSVPRGCPAGVEPSTWRETWPNASSSVQALEEVLARGPSDQPDSCPGETVVVLAPPVLDDGSMESSDFLSALAHVGGRWYFEATIEDPGSVGTSAIVGILAAPADLDQFQNPPTIQTTILDASQQTIPAARTHWSAMETIGVAADLDSGLVSFFKDGWRVEQHRVLQVPGVGAFHAAASTWWGHQAIRINLGSEPFLFHTPSGYRPWSAAPDDSPGVCVSDEDPALPSAPVRAECEESGCLSSFEPDTHAATDLVVLSVYEAGNDPGSEVFLGPDGNFHPGPTGSLHVEVKRPGRIALVVFSVRTIDWSFEVGPDTQLVLVSITGGEGQHVRGIPEGVPLEVRSYCGQAREPDCVVITNFASEWVGGLAWPYSPGSGDTQAAVEKIEAEYCLPLKIYASAYDPDSFVIE